MTHALCCVKLKGWFSVIQAGGKEQTIIAFFYTTLVAQVANASIAARLNSIRSMIDVIIYRLAAQQLIGQDAPRATCVKLGENTFNVNIGDGGEREIHEVSHLTRSFM